MAYSDAPSPRWDRIAGFGVWLILGFVLLEPLSGLLVADCISEPCYPSLGWRLLGLAVLTFSLSAGGGWASSALVKRLVYRGEL